MFSINNNHIILTLNEENISNAFQDVPHYLDPKLHVVEGSFQQCQWEIWNTDFENSCTKAAATLLPSEYGANKKLVKELRESIRQASALTTLKGYGPKARRGCRKMPVWPITIRLDLRKHRGIAMCQSSLTASAQVPNNLTIPQYQAPTDFYQKATAKDRAEAFASFPVPCGASHAGLADALAHIGISETCQGPDIKPCQSSISARNPPLFQRAKRSGPLAIVDPNTGLVKTPPIVAASAPVPDVTSRVTVAPSPLALEENLKATSSAPHLPKQQARAREVFGDPTFGQIKNLPDVSKRVVPQQNPSLSSSFSSTPASSTTQSPNISTSTNSSSAPPYGEIHCDGCLCLKCIPVRTPPPSKEKICSPECLCASVRKCIPYTRNLDRYPLGFTTEVEARDKYERLVQARCRKVQDQNERERRRSFDMFDHVSKYIPSYEPPGHQIMKGKYQYEIRTNVRYKGERYEYLNSVPDSESKTELVHFMQEQGYCKVTRA